MVVAARRRGVRLIIAGVIAVIGASTVFAASAWATCDPLVSNCTAAGTGTSGTSTPAVGSNAGALDTVMNNFETYTVSAGKAIKGEGAKLFWLLAGIEFSFAMIRLGITRAELSEWLVDLVFLVMNIGFFWGIFDNQGFLLPAIVNSFNKLGAQAVSTAMGGAAGSSTGMSPSSIMVAAATVATKIWKTSGFITGKVNPVVAMLMCIFVVIMYGIIAAFLAETLIESYFVLAAGGIILGFGGSRWTRQYALSILGYAVSVGVKLLIMDLVIGVGMTAMNAISSNGPNSVDGFWGTAITLIVLAAITKSVPSMAQAAVAGTPQATGSAISGAVKGAALGTAAVGAVAAGVGMVAAAGGPGKALAAGGRKMLEGARGMAAGGATPAQRLAAAKQVVGGMKTAATPIASAFGQAGKSALSDIGGKLTGNRHFGYSGARIFADMMANKKPAPKPAPPPPPGGDDPYWGA